MVFRYTGIPSVYGTMQPALGAVTLSAAGTFTPGIQGTMGSTLLSFAMSASGSAGQPVSSSDITTVTVTNTSPSSRTNWHVTFGHYFKKADVQSTATIGVKIGSTAIPCDVIHKATHSDGSLKHAVITCVLPNLAGNGSQTLTLYTQSVPGAGTAITKQDVLNTIFDATVSCTISGTTYSLTARELLDGTTARVLDTTWLSGANCSEFIVGGRLKSGVATHAHLAAYFHVRAYGVSGNVSRIRCDCVIENGFTFTAGSGLIAYTPSVSVAGTTAWNNGGASYNHYHHSRLIVTGWWGQANSESITHSTTYLKNSQAVPNYGTTTVTSAVLNSYTAYTPGARCDMRANWNDVAYHKQIGPMPEWDASYVKTGDPRAYNAVVANSKAGGSYSYHYRDENTGYPPSIDTYPTLSISDGTGGVVAGTGENVNDCGQTSDPCSHQPLIGYLAYLLTGDFYHLEELVYLANYDISVSSIGYRKYGTADNSWGMPGEQLRGRAWGIRTLAHAAAITPDAHPLKTYLNTKVSNCVTSYVNTGVTVGGSDYNTLGAPYDQDWTGSAKKYNVWQMDFLTTTIGRLLELGFSSTNLTNLANWNMKAQAGRMGQPGIGTGYCAYWASEYNFTNGLGQATLGLNNYYGTWGQVYAAQFGNACTPPGPGITLPGGFIDAMHPTSATDYAANLQAALSYSVNQGVSFHGTWSKFRSMTNIDYSGAPVWDIVPRVSVPAAISALASNQWHEFPNSNASAVTPCPVNNCAYSGNSGYTAVTNAWSGGAFDSKRDRLILWGGGHADYAGNELYVFDLRTGQWSLAAGPSTAVQGNVAYYIDGKPSSRHTFNYLQYLPETDDFVSLATGGTYGTSGAFGPWADAFNFGTASWTALAQIPENSFENEIGAFSAIDGFGNCWLHTSESPGRLYKYSRSANTWTAYSGGAVQYFPNQGVTAAVDTKRNRMIAVGESSGALVGWRWDLNNPNTAPIVLSGIPAGLNSPGAPGFDYDPIGDRFLVWNGGTTINVLNASTLVWSTLTTSGVNPGAVATNGTYGRFRYVPSLHGFVLVNSMTGSVYFLKL